jgi:hypothetical protein
VLSVAAIIVALIGASIALVSAFVDVRSLFTGSEPFRSR